MNRTQGVVLGFFALVWVSLVVILVVAPEVYDQALRLPGAEVPSSPFWRRSPGLSGCSSSA